MAPILLTGLAAMAEEPQARPPERVEFPAIGSGMRLVGYVFEPAPDGTSRQTPKDAAARHPAVILMHGRSGAYSTAAKGVYNASTLSARHKAWGQEWAAHGYVALLIDGFGPRGYPQGFPRYSYDDRPAELNEVTRRPLDAYAGLAYLGTRADVAADRVGLMGWSNGASAALAAMASGVPELKWPDMHPGFRAALAFYPACGLHGQFDERPFHPYAPVLILHGTGDEEVSSDRCASLAEAAQRAGGTVEIELFEDATHGFDSPTANRQSLEANREATEQATGLALSFFDRHVRGQAQAGRRDE